MKGNEIDLLYRWLKLTYPRKYANKSQEDEVLLKDNLSFAFEGYGIEEVMTAYRWFYDREAFEPAVSEIKSYLRGQQKDREREAEENAARQMEAQMDSLPEHHPRKGCYWHKEAFEEWWKDQKAGTRNGRDFPYYCKKYPKVVWRDWVNPSANADRFEEPNGKWAYMKVYKGWTINEKGFCVPKR